MRFAVATAVVGLAAALCACSDDDSSTSDSTTATADDFAYSLHSSVDPDTGMGCHSVVADESGSEVMPEVCSEVGGDISFRGAKTVAEGRLGVYWLSPSFSVVPGSNYEFVHDGSGFVLLLSESGDLSFQVQRDDENYSCSGTVMVRCEPADA